MHDSEERYPPPKCHPGTRQTVRDRITGWYGFKTRPEKGIMWVHGPAGYGKSAVAQTVSDDLEAQQQELGFNPVGATFFFWRTSPERNSPARFVITLAYQLAISIPGLLPHIEQATTRDPMILKKSLEVQLTRLIVEPFRALDNLDEMPNRLIIIDGLDECINSDQEFRLERKWAEDQERVQIRVLDLILTLHSQKLPLSFLVFSRSEMWIEQHMESKQFKPVTEVVDLFEVGDHLRDVEVYLKAELSRIAANLESHPGEDTSEWVGKDTLQTLLRKTGGHMLYASTVVRHIQDPYDDPRGRLQDILDADRDDTTPSTSTLAHSSSFSALHELYRQIMRSCPEEHRRLMLEVLEDLMAFSRAHSYATIRTALTVLDSLCGRAPGRGLKAIRNIRAVITSDCQGSPETFFVHSSFPEFLLDSRVALEFTIKFEPGERRLLLHCLRCMSSINLSTNVDEEHVQVALRNWPKHWQNSEPKDEADSTQQLESLLRALDLKACIVQAIKVEGCSKDQDPIFCSNLARVYRKTVVQNTPSVSNVTVVSRFYSADLALDQQTLAKECANSLNSSFEQALAHLLQPAIAQSPTSIRPSWVSLALHFYLTASEGAWWWGSGANKVVQAMNSLKKDNPHIHRELAYRWPRYLDPKRSLSEKYPFLFDVSDDQYVAERDKSMHST
ncbi:hypothetical protein EST38_g3872 [Candolleomyces aberdarensis]|uniref:Nephrocystin 3-like N-terminal domain-containing protein n=1 Tax=Candolleomyces aberdarensis TaxID=2316362 RepID=A0A4V1Q4G3_9AGAR|nr:hypothetical protein EST38_g3872 [Candolleomyces aberdarensis]